jgi:Haem-binding domain
MKKLLKILGVLIIAALLAIQAFRPERTNPVSDPVMAITAQLNVPPDVRTTLERSCYDCHSNQTIWPWYSAVNPVSWLVADDVTEGRRHLNFSEWGNYTPKRQIAKLDMIVSQVDKGEMPLGKYLLIHGNAALTDTDKDLLCTWANAVSDSLVARGQ